METPHLRLRPSLLLLLLLFLSFTFSSAPISSSILLLLLVHQLFHSALRSTIHERRQAFVAAIFLLDGCGDGMDDAHPFRELRAGNKLQICVRERPLTGRHAALSFWTYRNTRVNRDTPPNIRPTRRFTASLIRITSKIQDTMRRKHRTVKELLFTVK